MKKRKKGRIRRKERKEVWGEKKDPSREQARDSALTPLITRCVVVIEIIECMDRH